jgi:hypothetical protein
MSIFQHLFFDSTLDLGLFEFFIEIFLIPFQFVIKSFLCLFLIGTTLLHRYSTWLWTPKLPHMHIEHEQWAPSSSTSVAIRVSMFEVSLLLRSE